MEEQELRERQKVMERYDNLCPKRTWLVKEISINSARSMI